MLQNTGEAVIHSSLGLVAGLERELARLDPLHLHTPRPALSHTCIHIDTLTLPLCKARVTKDMVKLATPPECHHCMALSQCQSETSRLTGGTLYNQNWIRPKKDAMDESSFLHSASGAVASLSCHGLLFEILHDPFPLCHRFLQSPSLTSVLDGKHVSSKVGDSNARFCPSCSPAFAAAGARWDNNQEWQASISNKGVTLVRKTILAPITMRPDPVASRRWRARLILDRFGSGQGNVQRFVHATFSIPTLHSGLVVCGDCAAIPELGGMIL